MSEHTPGPWLYRPHRYDDWGWIRAQPESDDSVGPLIACAKSGKYMDLAELDVHRANKTDPYEANARMIAAAPDMLAALKALNKLISEAALTGFNYKDGDWADRLYASQQTTSAAIKAATPMPDKGAE